MCISFLLTNNKYKKLIHKWVEEKEKEEEKKKKGKKILFLFFFLRKIYNELIFFYIR